MSRSDAGPPEAGTVLAVLTPTYPISTERLRLRPFGEADLDYLAEVMARPDVLRYLYDEPRSRHEVAEVLARRIGYTTIAVEGDRISLVAEVTATGEVAGDVVLGWTSTVHSQGEIGFVFHPDHHGHGYATEAARVMLGLGFDGLGLHRMIGRCDARNDASAGVMERLGMRREAHLIQNEHVKGEWTDELVYAILESEWRDESK